MPTATASQPHALADPLDATTKYEGLSRESVCVPQINCIIDGTARLREDVALMAVGASIRRQAS
jgi:hypothetical protein